jgi:hypothetical protein
MFPSSTATGVLTGMFVGLTVILYVHFRTPLLWTWYVPLSAGITFFTGVIVSLAKTAPAAANETR